MILPGLGVIHRQPFLAPSSHWSYLSAPLVHPYCHLETCFPLSTHSQGRDLFSSLLYGTRISLLIGFASVALAMFIGILLGLLAGYAGGRVEAFIMRVADVQLSFPAILIALLIDGVARAMVPQHMLDSISFPVLIGAIALAGWPQYARTVRGSTMVEKNKEYIQAAKVIGISSTRIMLTHVLPNVMGPVLALAPPPLRCGRATDLPLTRYANPCRQ